MFPSWTFVGTSGGIRLYCVAAEELNHFEGIRIFERCTDIYIYVYTYIHTCGIHLYPYYGNLM